MPHADSAFVPSDIQTKCEFWNHVHDQLQGLLEGQRNWISNLANASALIYNALLAFPAHFGPGNRAVNWCGFYIDSAFFPAAHDLDQSGKLLLGPFCGKPACQFINITPGKARGVCADAYLRRETILVPDVERYPGHIACDGETKSEIVCPLLLEQGDKQIAVGVFDLDCLALEGFDEEDKAGLVRLADLVVKASDW
ncbi:GAF domain-like protein [Gloeophyllum trabeum ATCC 11539]|uniref:GAF domain-like protein n=1 Tax=Gloeophyllum trabeum (strain ATCC 11539 / FP-39264 / Madison 617) TaxID=670483 RepID=S7RR49_GLOTA|nr:GAF domain-like protein [Gloeophyllum trabeum ATCC 11539]EPQ57075.1 GAF domain-like protein [Gloeophyllum trabeum ATCC 11539]